MTSFKDWWINAFSALIHQLNDWQCYTMTTANWNMVYSAAAVPHNNELCHHNIVQIIHYLSHPDDTSHHHHDTVLYLTGLHPCFTPLDTTITQSYRIKLSATIPQPDQTQTTPYLHMTWHYAIVPHYTTAWPNSDLLCLYKTQLNYTIQHLHPTVLNQAFTWLCVNERHYIMLYLYDAIPHLTMPSPDSNWQCFAITRHDHVIPRLHLTRPYLTTPSHDQTLTDNILPYLHMTRPYLTMPHHTFT